RHRWRRARPPPRPRRRTRRRRRPARGRRPDPRLDPRRRSDGPLPARARRRVSLTSMDPTRTAVGTWSGGRFMHFGEALDDERFLALIRPGGGIDTVLTADTYGQGEADSLLGRALQGLDRASFSLVGAVRP